MEKAALIIIDIQNDYFPGGLMELEGAYLAASKAGHLLSHFRQQQQLVVFIQHETVDPNIPRMQPKTSGQEFHSSVLPSQDEICFTKHYPNSFWKTELESCLREQGITHLFIVGMMTHMCVSATTRAAMERGFKVTVIKDACATCALHLDEVEIPAETVHQTALAELTLLAQIKNLDSVIDQIS